MIEIKNFNPREYQKNILNTVLNYNTLVVLPTGLGKTAISMLLGVDRLNKFQNSKVLIIAPTKPLSSQHVQSFIDKTTIKPDKIVLLTGLIKPDIRKELWENASIIVATPQTIESDLNNNRISLENVSMLCIDECHRSREKFANTKVTQKYLYQAKNQRILALTASPGSTKERINEIRKNLAIEKIEIRTEIDEDVKPYIQKREIEWITVNLPTELKGIKNLINLVYKERLKRIKNLGFTKPLNLINKKDLLLLQNRFQEEIRQGNKTAFYSSSLIAQAIKLEHSITLLETQGIKSLKSYWKKLESDETRAAKNIINEKDIIKAISLTNELIEKNFRHPKEKEFCKLIEKELIKNPKSKIIVFANYRFTVDELILALNNIKDAKPIKLIGQKEGLTQKQQIQIIKDFEKNIYNILVGTSISEEGLDISGGADLAIFFEAIPSEIRSIQRKGRVGRIKLGRIIFLITKGTKDEAFYWSSFHKEKKMRHLLYSMQDKPTKKKKENQTTLI